MKKQFMDKPIHVTQPSLPPLVEYVQFLKEIWETGILTHNGPLLQRLERELSIKLGIKNFIAVTNGTVAIQMAIKALDLKGEIITTPFSWVATISAIKWEGCTPIFCDVDSQSLNIDTSKLESLISDKTVAIMPVHVFGNPCDVEGIARIAKKYNLKVIYDAAHAIGSTYKGKSVFEFGDISATSLHGTKLLNTAEGGGCITTNQELFERLKRIRFFGHDNSKVVIEDGFNGKMTEVHAALGLANLKYFEDVLQDRKAKYFRYYHALSGNGQFTFQRLNGDGCNYSYFPIIFKNEEQLIEVERRLNENGVYPRRYFYPSLNTMNHIVGSVSMPISENISQRILCLPLYKNLTNEEVDSIIRIIIE
jgi:dTDP-4-amino-4,6-dideoxygalactose transaminase